MTSQVKKKVIQGSGPQPFFIMDQFHVGQTVCLGDVMQT